jgi:hypothetical protein
MKIEETNADSKQSPYIKLGIGVQKTKDSLEITGKIFVLLIGTCYVVGLIVVNIHLSQFRIYSLNLLQLNCVLAGIWTLLPMLPAWFIIAGFFNIVFSEIERRKGGQWTWKNKLVLGSVVITAPIISYFPIGFLADYLGFRVGWRWSLVLMLGAFVSAMLSGMVVSIPKHESYATIQALAQTSFSTFITAGIFIFYVAVFARGPYSDIPSGLGGGRPIACN